MNKKQTAVEWLIEQLEEKGDLRETPSIRNIQLNIDTSDYMELKQQAKEMDKERMIEFAQLYAVIHCMGDITKNADEYYTETYGGNK
jgi:hypothetical protein